MASNYAHGRQTEWAIRDHLEDNGYQVIRAAGSKGAADLVAIKPSQVLLINVKRTTPPGPRERAALLGLARTLPSVGVPLIAMKPPYTKAPTYRRLTGLGPKDWEPWTPDTAEE